MALPAHAKKVALAGLIGAATAAAASVGAKVVWPYHVPLEIALILGTPAGFLAGTVGMLLRLAVGAPPRNERRHTDRTTETWTATSQETLVATPQEPDVYHCLLNILTWVGVVTFIGGLLWIVAGTGIYGSPLGGIAFDQPGADWGFWIMLVVIGGPLALLPCVFLERQQSRAGACALGVAAFLTAEAGIRASQAAWGFSGDGLIVISCISVPQLAIAGILFMLGSKHNTTRAKFLCLVIGAVAISGICLRYAIASDHWKARSDAPPPVSS